MHREEWEELADRQLSGEIASAEERAAFEAAARDPEFRELYDLNRRIRVALRDGRAEPPAGFAERLAKAIDESPVWEERARAAAKPAARAARPRWKVGALAGTAAAVAIVAGLTIGRLAYESPDSGAALDGEPTVALDAPLRDVGDSAVVSVATEDARALVPAAENPEAVVVDEFAADKYWVKFPISTDDLTDVRRAIQRSCAGVRFEVRSGDAEILLSAVAPEKWRKIDAALRKMNPETETSAALDEWRDADGEARDVRLVFLRGVEER
ncbi:MAG: hypothetical protein HUK22_08275 [Thermoguttaceae bacterium]|nr:hypothetical protein [Thermoguttaceae bacterium]